MMATESALKQMAADENITVAIERQKNRVRNFIRNWVPDEGTVEERETVKLNGSLGRRYSRRYDVLADKILGKWAGWVGCWREGRVYVFLPILISITYYLLFINYLTQY